MRRRTVRAWRLCVCLSALAMGCHPGESAARAEAARLRQQIRALRTIVEDEQAGRLFPNNRLGIGLRQELVRDLMQRRLPVEAVPVEPFRVRLETADIVFEGGQSLVTLQGRVHATTHPDVHADIVLYGGLHQFEVDTREGILTAQVDLERVDVRRKDASAVERGMMEGINEALRGPGLGPLGDVLPPVEMPVRLDPVLDFPGIAGGVLTVPPRQLPVDASVARVVPVAGRLWVFLDMAPRK